MGQQPKRDHSADEEEEVDGPVEEGGGEGEQEEEGEDDAESGGYFDVDEALAGVGGGVAGLVQVFAVEAGDDGCEGQLGWY